MKRGLKHLLFVLVFAVLLPFGATKANAASPYMAIRMNKGQSVSLAACVGNASPVEASWASTKKSVASVTSYGVVKGLKYGETTIKAKYKGVTRSIKVLVVPKLQKVTLNKKSITLEEGKSYKLVGKITPAGTKLVPKWSSSKTSVATVSGGVVKAKKAGTAYITYRVNDKTAKCKVTVKKKQVKKYKVTGTITNAANGRPMSNAKLVFRKGYNKKSGSAYASTKSNSQGKYNVNLEAGKYTLAASKSGYATTYTNIYCKNSNSGNYSEVSITQKLENTQYRAVLSWGKLPYDLDSHLSGPLSNGNRFHVYYSNKNAYNNGGLVANLDVDDRVSYGPETVTINFKAGTNGTYRYFVHDFSNRSATGCNDLSMSGARVTLFKGNKQIASYYVPKNAGGTLWHVFDIENGKVKKVNTMSYHYGSTSSIG